MRTQNLIISLGLAFLIMNCGGKDALDYPFSREMFTSLHLSKLMEHPDISAQDRTELFYLIRRHDDLGIDSLEGTSYRDLLTEARKVRVNGWPQTIQRTETASLDPRLQISVSTTGVGLQRVGESSRLRKSSLAQMSIQNTGDAPLAIHAVYADIYGPMGDWLTTVAYELNCIVDLESPLKADLMIDGVKIDAQTKLGSDYGYLYASMDSILSNLRWDILHVELVEDTRHYSPCRSGEERRIPSAQVLGTEEKYQDYCTSEKSANGEELLLLKSARLDFSRAEVLQYR